MDNGISRNTERMLKGKNIWLYILLLSLPILINNLIKSFNGLVDIFFVSRMDASQQTIESAISALNLHDGFNNVLLALGVGLAIASMAVISQFLGAKRPIRAKFFAGQFITISVIVGLVLTVFVLASSWLFIDLMGAKGETYTFALEYFNIRSFELVSVVFFLVYQAIRQSEGSTLKPTIYNVSGILVNIVLTWYFVEVLKLGVIGSAWSTLIGNSIFIPLMVLDLIGSKKYIKLELKDFIPKKASFIEIWPFAYPAAVAHAITYFGHLLINVFVLTLYGDTILSSFSTGNKLSSLLMNPIYAITTISAVFIGTNIGHKQPKEAMKIYRETGVMTLTLTLIAVTFAIIYREQLVIALIGNNSPELVRIASEYTLWLLLTQPFMAIFQNFMAIYNGSGQSNLGLRAQSVRLWVLRMPALILLFIFMPHLEYSIVWIAMNFSNIVVLGYAYYLRRKVNLQIKVNLGEYGDIYV